MQARKMRQKEKPLLKRRRKQPKLTCGKNKGKKTLNRIQKHQVHF